ncbi:MAG: helix-turn-helix transcriptional regulator [Bacillota bacterium]|nr:helix-turn-helix transcriptional regulator [Bacillota bacterium]
MDTTLERILSLIPRKPDGKYVHGAIKEFCEATGAPHSALKEWEQGTTMSYRKYLYKIAQKYDVSVEWLEGKTDEKNPPSNNESGLDDIDAEIIELLKSKTAEQRAAILQLLRSNL